MVVVKDHALRLADVTRLAGAVQEMLTDMTAAAGEAAALRERCKEFPQCKAKAGTHKGGISSFPQSEPELGARRAASSCSAVMLLLRGLITFLILLKPVVTASERSPVWPSTDDI